METPQPAPAPNPAPAADAKPPRKKRSLMEKIIVWGGILILVGVLGMEWNSKNGYENSYKAIQASFDSRDADGKFQRVPMANIDKVVVGFPNRGEEILETKGLAYGGKEAESKKQRRVVYTWPSLFKQYKIAVPVDEKENGIYVEMVLPE